MQKINGSLFIKVCLYFFVLVVLINSFALADVVQITDCQLLDQSNTEYVLQNDVSYDGTCFAVKGNNIILNLNGHTVSFGNPVVDDYSYGLLCHSSYVPPGRPSNWVGGGSRLIIKNGNFIQKAAITKKADTNVGTSSHTLYLRSCNNPEISNLTITTNSKNDATIVRLRSIQNAKIHDLIINNNVQNITNRHYPGQESILVESGSGNYQIYNNQINGGPHKGITISGTYNLCDVYNNTIKHNQKYVNGYAFSLSGINLNVHDNVIEPIVGRGVHLKGSNILFHDNYLNLKLKQVTDHYNTDDFHNIFTNVHGIKFEDSTSKNNKVYSNVIITTQPSNEYAPVTPLNIYSTAINANNEIYDNIIRAETFASVSGGTQGYGKYDEYAVGIYLGQCTGTNPGSVHNNVIYSNDMAVLKNFRQCSNFKIYDNQFIRLENPTSNSRSIAYFNYNEPSQDLTYSNNYFDGFSSDDTWFQSSTYEATSFDMEFKLIIKLIDGNDDPIPNPQIIIKDKNDNVVFSGTGNSLGVLEKDLLMYKLNKNNVAEILSYSPYKVIYDGQEFEITLDKSKFIVIKGTVKTEFEKCMHGQVTISCMCEKQLVENKYCCFDQISNNECDTFEPIIIVEDHPCDESDITIPYKKISNQELLAYITKWKSGTGATIIQLLDAIKKWKNGC